MTAERKRARPARRGCVLAVALLVVPTLFPTSVLAQRRYFGIGHSLRLEGFVEPAEDADVLGEISIRSGDMLRRFGVTSAIAPGEDSMAIFRNQTLRRETFKLVAKTNMLQNFNQAAPGTKLRMTGVLQPDSFLISSIEVLAPSPAP
jgi:hypothetical protein